MTMKNVVKGKLTRPRRIVLSGTEGIGKTTWAAQAPKPIFLGAEDGTAQHDVSRFPEPRAWTDATDAVQCLISEKHDYKTLVIDTIDWLEPLCWEFICGRDSKADIEAYGYGKGYLAALSEWRVILRHLDTLRHKRNMSIILLAHTHIRPFRNPEGDDYDRYEMKIHTKSAGLIREWADCVFFANYETFTREGSAGRTKGIDNGARVLYTERRAAFDAKNREGFPPKIALSWDEFAALTDASAPVSIEELKTKAQSLIDQTIGDVRTKAEQGYKKASKDTQKMTILINWLKGKVAA
jgi:hypothetical protein